MGFRDQIHTITGTSPASASSAVIGTVTGLMAYDEFQIVSILTGGTGTAGDVAWLQFRLDPAVDVWVDWIRFAALTAGTTVKQIVSPVASNTLVTIGTGTAAAPGTVTIAASACGGGKPGDTARLVFTAGASTSAGATQTVYIRGWRRRV